LKEDPGMEVQELKDEIQLLKDRLYFSERARDGHYRKLQIALKRIEELEQMQPIIKKAVYADLDDEL
jgi:hypothetical protein